MSCQTPSCKRLRSGSGLARRSGSTSDRKSTRLNSSYDQISYAVFCLKKKIRRVLFRSDRKSTRLNSSHDQISYAVFCLKKKKTKNIKQEQTYDSMTQRTMKHIVSHN